MRKTKAQHTMESVNDTALNDDVLFRPNERDTAVNLEDYRTLLEERFRRTNGHLDKEFLCGWTKLRSLDVTPLKTMNITSIADECFKDCCADMSITGLHELRAGINRKHSVQCQPPSNAKVLPLVKPLSSVATLSVLVLVASVALYCCFSASSFFYPPQAPTWHGCEALTHAPVEVRTHPLIQRLLSTRARQHTARLIPMHVISDGHVPVVSYLQNVSSSVCADCLLVSVVPPSTHSVELFTTFFQDMVKQTTSDRKRCWFIIVPFDHVSASVVNAFKEIAELNTLRGESMVPDGTQGMLLLTTRGDRAWLLNQVEHRTVHVMPTTTFV